jgi:hypothetical protein
MPQGVSLQSDGVARGCCTCMPFTRPVPSDSSCPTQTCHTCRRTAARRMPRTCRTQHAARTACRRGGCRSTASRAGPRTRPVRRRATGSSLRARHTATTPAPNPAPPATAPWVPLHTPAPSLPPQGSSSRLLRRCHRPVPGRPAASPSMHPEAAASGLGLRRHLGCAGAAAGPTARAHTAGCRGPQRPRGPREPRRARAEQRRPAPRGREGGRTGAPGTRPAARVARPAAPWARAGRGVRPEPRRRATRPARRGRGCAAEERRHACAAAVKAAQRCATGSAREGALASRAVRRGKGLRAAQSRRRPSGSPRRAPVGKICSSNSRTCDTGMESLLSAVRCRARRGWSERSTGRPPPPYLVGCRAAAASVHAGVTRVVRRFDCRTAVRHCVVLGVRRCGGGVAGRLAAAAAQAQAARHGHGEAREQEGAAEGCCDDHNRLRGCGKRGGSRCCGGEGCAGPGGP